MPFGRRKGRTAMVAIGIAMGAAGAILQLWLLRRILSLAWTPARRMVFFLVRLLLWAALLIGSALISLPTLIALVATLTPILIGYQVTIYIRLRKEDHS